MVRAVSGAISPLVAGRYLSSNGGEGAIDFRKTLSALFLGLCPAWHSVRQERRASSQTDHNAPSPDSNSKSHYTIDCQERGWKPQKSALAWKSLLSRSGLRSDFLPHIPKQSPAYLRGRRARWQSWASPRARGSTMTAI